MRNSTPLPIPGDLILERLPQVKARTGLSRSEIYRRIAAGTFPSQITLGPKSVAWVEAEVLAWCDSLVAQRGEAA